MIQLIRNGSTIIELMPTSGTQTRQAMGVNIVDLQFTLFEPFVFEKGDYCIVFGEKYIINILPSFVKVNERRYEYDVQLEHEFYSLQDVKYLAPDSENHFTDGRFSLTADANGFLGLLLNNANRVFTGWSLGVIQSTETRTLSFEGENLLQVLTRLADEFQTEYWVENKTIHFNKRDGDTEITLGYGENKGLISLTKGNKDRITIFTRLYVEGGSRNLPTGYRNNSKNLLIPVTAGDYIEDEALSEQYGVIEQFQTFDDIFPKRVGVITALGDDEFEFIDLALTFDVNDYLLNGVSAKIVFQTGLLAGYEFEVSSYNDDTKKFIILANGDENTIELPNDTLKPAIGDEYLLLDITLPAEYVTAAEEELLAAAEAHYEKGSDITYNDKFDVDCDPLYFKRNSLEPVLGYTINIVETSPAINVTKRIATIKRDLLNIWKYELEITDKIELTSVARTYAEQVRVNRIIFGGGFIGGVGNPSNGSFLATLSVKAGYLYISGAKAKAGYADVAEDAIHAFVADLATVANLARDVQSTDFVSGVTGEGHRLDNGVLEVDNIIARKGIDAYSLNIREITGSGGSIAVTNVGKILTVTGSGPYVCTFDTDGGTIANPFQLNDIVRCQVWDSAAAKYYLARVSAVASDSFTLTILEGTGVPAAGDKLFQFGNTTDTARQGLLYLTNSDTGAPYMDVLDDINSSSLVDKTKVRVGKLNGITSSEWGGLTGYGLYGGNVYLENAKVSGIINVTGGNAATQANITFLQGQIDDVGVQMIAFDAQLANFADDDKLTPVEKTAIQVQYNAAANEVEDIKTRAASYGVSSTAYNAAFIDLQDYVVPLLLALTTTSDIDGETLRTLFQDYFIQKSLLLKAIQNKIQELHDEVADFTGITDPVVVAKAGESLFEGGYLKTELIEVEQIIVQGNLATLVDLANVQDDADAANAWIAANSAVLADVKEKTDDRTVIAGGIVQTGVLMVGDGTTTAGGLSGVVNAGVNSVWLWGGTGYNNRETAPFRVTQQGYMYAYAGVIGGFKIESSKLSSGNKVWGSPALELDANDNTFKFYSGYMTGSGSSGGTLIPDIEIRTSTGFGSTGSLSIGEIRFNGQFIDANRDATTVGGNGVFSNSSNTSFTAASGFDSNASVVGLLRRGSSYVNGLSAGVVGIDQTDGSSTSKCFGGYFSSIHAGALHLPITSHSTNTSLFCTRFTSVIVCYTGSGGSTIYLPTNAYSGRIIIVKNMAGAGLTISRQGSQTIIDVNGAALTSTAITGGESMEFIYDGGGRWAIITYTT